MKKKCEHLRDYAELKFVGGMLKKISNWSTKRSFGNRKIEGKKQNWSSRIDAISPCSDGVSYRNLHPSTEAQITFFNLSPSLHKPSGVHSREKLSHNMVYQCPGHGKTGQHVAVALHNALEVRDHQEATGVASRARRTGHVTHISTKRGFRSGHFTEGGRSSPTRSFKSQYSKLKRCRLGRRG